MVDIRKALGLDVRARRQVDAIFKANPGLRQRFTELGLDEMAVEAAIEPALAMLDRRFPRKAIREIARSLDDDIRAAIETVERAIKDGELRGGERTVNAWSRQLLDPGRHFPLTEKKGVQPHTVFEKELRRRGIKQGLAREIVWAWVELKKGEEIFATKNRQRKMSHARESLAHAREQRAYFRTLRRIR